MWQLNRSSCTSVPLPALVRGASECSLSDRTADRSAVSAAPVNVTSPVPGAFGVAGLWAGRRAARHSGTDRRAIQSH